MNKRFSICRRIAAERGFSLIEVLIVMVVLVVLIAIAVPALTGSKRAIEQKIATDKLGVISSKQKDFRKAFGLKRYGSIDELKSATADLGTLISDDDLRVTGWQFLDIESPTNQTFGVAVQPTEGNPSNYSYVVFEDNVVRVCMRGGPYHRDSNICPSLTSGNMPGKGTVKDPGGIRTIHDQIGK